MIHLDDLKKALTNEDLLRGSWPNKEWNLCYDSRKIKSGELFYAIRGENHDAFRFWKDVLTSGADGIIFESSSENEKRATELQLEFPKALLLSVGDCCAYLQRLGTIRLNRWRNSRKDVVALTGSNGKTTTKEMLKFLLEGLSFNVLSTQGNLNNHWGVPMTLCRLEENHQIALIEMGTNHPGEIETLCRLAPANFGLITNIGDAHLEFFETRENIFWEKSALFRAIDSSTEKRRAYIINNNDKLLKTLPDKLFTHRYGKDGDYFLVSDELVFKNGIKFKLNNSLGRHNTENLAMAIGLVNEIKSNCLEKIIQLANTFKMPEMNRSQWLDWQGKRVFLDAYNANPSSMQAAITFFCEKVGTDSSLCVLGDMNELGPRSEEFHEALGAFVREKGLSSIFIGRFAKAFMRGAGPIPSFESVATFAKSAKEKLQGHKNIMIKGSNSLHLESILDITGN